MSQPYPPQQPQQPPGGWGPQQPSAKKRKWPWVVGGLVAIGVIGAAVGGNNDPAPSPAADTVPAVEAPAPEAAAPVAPVPAPAPAPAPEPVAPAGPQMTVSQENAVESAENYLSFAGFSRTGLIRQLEFEGYSNADATFAVDNVTVDWMVEAEQSARSYMEFSSFSRSGLINQLEFEGYTSEQAQHGADSVGL